MISAESALQSILDTTKTLSTVIVPLENALNSTLSEPTKSPIDMPPFDQSAMDGYAIFQTESNEYHIIGEIQAGANATEIVLQPGEAVRIFTGAMVPKSATTVVKQEITTRTGDQLSIHEPVQADANIRRAAEQIATGALALDRGAVLNAGAIGFLAMLGITEVAVYRKPIVKILITGDELVSAGTTLAPGQIYESNSTTLIAACQELGISASSVTVKDDFEATCQKIKELLNECDLLITSGGVSVGDYDFVGKAMLANGVQEIFHKVKQKPGKPLFYGKNDTCSVFGLPGNPAAALTSFYLYVLPAIHKMMGRSSHSLEKRILNLQHDYQKTGTLTHFLKGHFDQQSVAILEHQSSAMLSSFAAANCIIEFDETRERWNQGDQVPVYILP